MMKYEFEKIAGYRVSDEDYNKIIEPMYNATDLDKIDFVKVIDRKRFEIKEEKTAEQIEIEKKINNEISNIKKEIEYIKQELEMKERTLEIEDDPAWIKIWKSDIKRHKEELKLAKNRITALKWVLA